MLATPAPCKPLGCCVTRLQPLVLFVLAFAVPLPGRSAPLRSLVEAQALALDTRFDASASGVLMIQTRLHHEVARDREIFVRNRSETESYRATPRPRAVDREPNIEIEEPNIEIELALRGNDTPLTGKWVLALIEVLGLGLCGIDRCYMGQIGLGIAKGCTLGGLGVWFLLDYGAVVVVCLGRAHSINALGFSADFVPEPKLRLTSSYSLALGSVCICAVGLLVAGAVAFNFRWPDMSTVKLARADPDVGDDAIGAGLGAEAKVERVWEFGGPVSTATLFSKATNLEVLLFTVGCLAAILHGVGQPFLFEFMGELVDATSAELDADFVNNVNDIIRRLSVVGVAIAAAAAVQHFGLGYFAELQVAKLRPLYFRALLCRDAEWLDTQEVRSLHLDVDEDMGAYKAGVGMKFGSSLNALAYVVASFLVALTNSWKLALVMTASVPLSMLSFICFSSAAVDEVGRQIAYTQAAKVAEEVLFAIRTVQSFGGERREIARYGSAVEEAAWGGIYQRTKLGAGLGWSGFVLVLSLGVAVYTAYRIVNAGDHISVGRMSTAIYAALGAASMLPSTHPGLASFMAARRTMARFFYLVENQGEIERHMHDNRPKCPPITTLELVNVNFSYAARQEVQVLRNVTLKIEKGQRVAVVGASGSGKSTVAALLERLYDPMSGEVLVNGLNLRQFSVASYRSQIGYVGQEPVLFATSVKNNILQGAPGATTDDVARVAKLAKLDFLDSLPKKLETYVGLGGSTFTCGQKQRIAIACALLKSPSMLLLDEATSALDPVSEQVVQHTLDSIGTSSELGLTVVSIAHRLCAVRNADVIYVVQDGEVVEQGNHSTLFANPDSAYRALMSVECVDVAITLEGEEASDSIVQGGLDEQVVKGALEGVELEKLPEQDIASAYFVPMRRLLGFCRPEWWALLPAVAAAAASGAVFPILGAYLIVDACVAFIQHRDTGGIVPLGDRVFELLVFFLVTSAVRGLGSVVQHAAFGLLGESMINRCRIAMLTSILRQDLCFHDDPKNAPARLARSLQVYAYRLAEFSTAIGYNADMLSALVVGLVVSFVAQWKIAAVAVATLPLLGISLYLENRLQLGGAIDEDLKLKAAAQVLSDALTGARTLHATGGEALALELYTSHVGGEESRRLTLVDIGTSLAFGVSRAMMFFVVAVGYWYQAHLISRGHSEFGSCLRAYMGISYAGQGMSIAVAGLVDLTKAKAAAHDVFRILDRVPTIDGLEGQGAKGRTLEEDKELGRIEFVGVHFSYPGQTSGLILDNVSFAVEAGQSVGICGASGNSKSLLLALIQRFYDPQKGGVRIGGGRALLTGLDVRWWRKQVGFVGQEPVLFDTSIQENVLYGLGEGEVISRDRLRELQRVAHLDFLDAQPQGWDTPVGPRGFKLSGGQKWRVAIGRALARDPAVLLVDEPTVSMDSGTVNVVYRALEEARIGRTSFTVAQQLSAIRDCDVLLVMADGRVAECGTHDVLLELHGIYSKLIGLESSLVGTPEAVHGESSGT